MENTRSNNIIKAGWLFILINFLLAIFNIAVGLIAGSVAVVSDAIHSLVDAVAGIFIIASEKIAVSQRFSAHRRLIERLTTILIAIIMIVIGVRITIEAAEKIMVPREPEYSIYTFIVLIASLMAKMLLASYLRKVGKEEKSKVVSASGAETFVDAAISAVVLISAVIYLIFKIDIEAYVTVVVAAIIIKVGLEFVFPRLTHHHHHPLDANPAHGTKK